ncbi:hypothetical protein [Glaciibacter flavus]|uniref:hypothetical protein n=1 Tax=Orlajensenia flava TaxID=2565934 RepID=UPI003B008661
MGSRDRLWVIGAIFIAAVIVAGGYFLGISPQLAAASVADSDLDGVQLQNAKLEGELKSLASDKKQIAQLQATAAGVAGALPAVADYATFIRSIDATAAAAGVTVIGFESKDPVPYAPPAVAAAPAPAAGGESAGSTPAPTATPAPAATPAAPAAPASAALYSSGSVTSSNLLTLPVTIKAQADNSDKLFAFLHGLQFGARQLSVTTVDRAEDNTIAIDGFIYVLLPASGATTPPAAPAS